MFLLLTLFVVVVAVRGATLRDGSASRPYPAAVQRVHAYVSPLSATHADSVAYYAAPAAHANAAASAYERSAVAAFAYVRSATSGADPEPTARLLVADACTGDETAAAEASANASQSLVTCIDASRTQRVRVHLTAPLNETTSSVHVEHWLLRRGGDVCHDARTLLPEASTGASYTLACAPLFDDVAHEHLDDDDYDTYIEPSSTRVTWFRAPFESTDAVYVTLNDTASLASGVGAGAVPPYAPYAPAVPDEQVGVYVAFYAPHAACSVEARVGDVQFVALQAGQVRLEVPGGRLSHVAIFSHTYTGDFTAHATDACAGLALDDAAASASQRAPSLDVDALCAEAGACSANATLDMRVLRVAFDSTPSTSGAFYDVSAWQRAADGVHVDADAACVRVALVNTSNGATDERVPCELATPNERFGGIGCGHGGSEGAHINAHALGVCARYDARSTQPAHEYGGDGSIDTDVGVVRVTFRTRVVLERVVVVSGARSRTPAIRLVLADVDDADVVQSPVPLDHWARLTATADDVVDDTDALVGLPTNAVYNVTLSDALYVPPVIRAFEIESGGATYGGPACLVAFDVRVLELNDLCGCAPPATPVNVAHHAALNAARSGACCVFDAARFNAFVSCTDVVSETTCMSTAAATEQRTFVQGAACATDSATACVAPHWSWT